MKFNHRAKSTIKALGISEKRADALQHELYARIQKCKKPISTSHILECCHAISETQAELLITTFIMGRRCAREEMKHEAMREMESIIGSLERKSKGKK